MGTNRQILCVRSRKYSWFSFVGQGNVGPSFQAGEDEAGHCQLFVVLGQNPGESNELGIPTLRQVAADDLGDILPEELEEPQITPDVPPGLEEEAWDTHVQVYSLRISNVIPTPNVPANKIGKGNRPCFVCGSGEHSWIKCSQKKKGKCAVCGSRDHYTRFCAQRYRPDPQLISKLAGQSGAGRTRTPDISTSESKGPNRSFLTRLSRNLR